MERHIVQRSGGETRSAGAAEFRTIGFKAGMFFVTVGRYLCLFSIVHMQNDAQ